MVDELARVEGKAEIIHGQIVHLPITGIEPGYAGDEIFVSLRQYARESGFGLAVGDGKGFLTRLPHRQSFSPDTAFYIGPASGMKFFPEAPVFAVEGDDGHAAEHPVADKRADYFAAGTQVLWDVDLLGPDTVHTFRVGDATTPAAVYRCGDHAEAEGAVPDWTMPVDDLFQA